MIPKLKNKFVLISIISVIVVTSIALFTVPALAAGLPWGPRGGANSNYARVQGTISSLTASAIEITPTTTNGSTSSVLGLNLTSSTNFAIHGNNWLSNSSLTSGSSSPLVGKTVNATYDKISLDAIQVMIGMPAVTPASDTTGKDKNFASVAASFGNVSNSGVDINITGSIPDGTTLAAPSNSSNVTIIYNSSTGAIRGIMLDRSGEPTSTPKAQSNQNFAFVTGTLETVSNNAVDITITGAIPSVSALVAPSTGSNVTIIYNNASGELQGVMVNGSGRFPFMPNNRPNINFASVQGTVKVADTTPYTITITPSTEPSVGLTETSGQTVTIIYNSSTGAIRGIMPAGSGQQPTPTYRTPSNNSFAAVQGTVSVADNVITITPKTAPSVTLTATSGQVVNILYNSSTGAVQGIMLPRSGQAPLTPNNQSNQNSPNWNGHRPFGQFGSFGHEGMNR